MSNHRDLDRENGDAPFMLGVDSSGPRDSFAGAEMDHISHYARVLYKRRTIVLSVFLLVSVVAVLESFSGVARYEARVQLLIEPDIPEIMDFRSVAPTSLPGVSEDAFYQTQLRILQSRSLARKTLEDQRLWDHPQFGGSGPGVVATPRNLSVRRWITGAYSAVIDAVTGLFEDSAAKAVASQPSTPEVEETKSQSRAIDAFLGHLTVSLVRNSRLVTVAFEADDPVLAAKAANAVANGYIVQTLESRFIAVRDASNFLAQRLTAQRKEVEGSEMALQKYREQNDAVSLDDKQNIVVQKLADLNSAVTRAKTVRIEKQALYNQLKGIQNDRTALDTVPAVLSHAYIQQLKVELANLQRQEKQLAETMLEKHPDVIKVKNAVQLAEARLQGEIGKVVESIRNEYLAAEAQERGLTAALEAQKSEALQLNRKAIEYNVLERDAATNRQMFESLLQRAKETGISEELKTSNARIMDLAEVPRGPITRNRGRNVLFGVFTGLLVGVALGFVIDYLDSRIKSPEEIQAHLRIAFLGMLPALELSGPEVTPLMHKSVPRNFGEAIRGLRTNVLFSRAAESFRSLVVTSAQPGDGKTLIASNLAIALAEAGSRVLLIDADMRQSRIHSVFSISQTPGLSNLIVGTAKASEVVLKTDVPNLWILPAGAHPPNPTELLGSKRFHEFLNTLRDHFDWVIIDSPPVMAVTDAAILGHLASSVLFVVASEITHRETARTALGQLDRAGANVIGAVLNRAELHRHPYYYAEYTKSAYSKYYQSA
jgi:capsular exopolysaccharide synthesis family protein